MNTPATAFQMEAYKWAVEALGSTLVENLPERQQRFLEESLELVQACGCPRDVAHDLVEFVYNRPVGELRQEIGGTMLTLAVLCHAYGICMKEAGDAELVRAWGLKDEIKTRQLAKPKFFEGDR